MNGINVKVVTCSPPYRYERLDECTVVSLQDGIRRLGVRAIHVVGDSVNRYLYESLRMLRRRAELEDALCNDNSAFSFRRAFRALRNSRGLEVGGPSHWILENFRRFTSLESPCKPGECFEGTTYGAIPLICGAMEWLSKGLPRDDVVLINIGLWYNVNFIEKNITDAETSLSELLRDLHPPSGMNGVQAARWMYQRLGNHSRPDCQEAFRTGQLWNMDPRQYAYSLVMLAEHVATHQRLLPKHIFWVDTTAQHWLHGTYEREETNKSCTPMAGPPERLLYYWRNAIAARIWPVIAPSVRFVHTYEVLREGWSAHMNYVGDCTHYCLGSQVWNEHVASVLTAVVHHLSEYDLQHKGVPIREASLDRAVEVERPTEACIFMAGSLDRFLASGRFTLYLSIGLCSTVLYLYGLLCASSARMLLHACATPRVN